MLSIIIIIITIIWFCIDKIINRSWASDNIKCIYLDLTLHRPSANNHINQLVFESFLYSEFTGFKSLFILFSNKLKWFKREKKAVNSAKNQSEVKFADYISQIYKSEI